MLFTNFTQQYPLSKTLRFELKPIAKTLEHIRTKNFLEQDITLAESYQKIKPILDDYHRDFIEQALQGIELAELSNFQTHYLALKQNRNDDKSKMALQKLQKDLCQAIAKKFEQAQKNNPLFANLHKADLFNKDILKNLVKNERTNHLNKVADIERFKRFAGYFDGFQTSRENFYSKEAKKGAIAYRIVYENLPRFCNNMDVLRVILQKHPELYVAIQQILSDIDLSDINYYNKCLSQSGIDKYNIMIGEINQKTNEYNQKNKLTGRNKIANLRKLYKQILSLPEEDMSFLPESLKNDKELVVALNGLYFGMDNQSIYTKMKQLMCEIENSYNLDKIYINPKKIAYLSKCAYDNWHLLRILLEKDFQQNNPQNKKETDEDYHKRQSKYVESYHSIAYLDTLINKHNQSIEDKLPENAIINTLMSFKKLVIDKSKSDTEQESMKCIIMDINNKYDTIKGLLNDDYEDDSKKLCSKNKDNVDNNIYNIKLFLDAIGDFWEFSKILHIKNQSSDMAIDTDFYAKFEELHKSLGIYILTYNKARNYLTQKVDNTQKIKLNFGNAYLLDGWDLNKEKDNFGIILQKNGNYYLAILDKDHKKVFEQAPVATSQDVYQKMVYKLLPGPNKMLPKVFFANSNIGYYAPPQELLEKYKQDTHKKKLDNGKVNELFSLADCHRLIDFFKASINKHPEWKEFGFVFSDTSTYQDLSDFYKEVEPQGYKVRFVDIDSSYIDELVEQGKLYLFQIYNKDFSDKSYGKKNMHTLYFQALFSPENLQNVVYKLNGEAEIFYRRSSLNIDDVAKHPAGEVLKMKNPNNRNQNKIATHTIYKDKRYTEDKFLLHIPITMNFGVNATGFKEFNKNVNQTLKNSKDDIHIIGIDRGERHLLYVSVINQKGEIIEQKSLNEIINIGHNNIKLTANYHDILDKKEKERADARVNWGEIENIKEIKAGYLSQVVHYISQLMLKYNAMIVLEDLNFGFKRGRFKVEKQVYQNFENALIKKLNYLVFKDKNADELGGIKNALQLTNKFEDIKEIGKQTGFLFYVPAWNTSKIDPTTGFVDLLKPHYESIEKSIEFFKKFNAIRYRADDDCFEFVIDYQNFGNKANGSKTDWVIYSSNDVRYAYNAKNKSTETLNVNQSLKELFKSCDIDYQTGNNLIDSICQNHTKKLHSGLCYLLKILLAMRYSYKERDKDGNIIKEWDFILSPVKNNQGEFFDSRKIEALPEKERKLPENSDANGAYHIALKGLWVLEQIKASDDLDKLKLAISNQEWLEFTQNRNQ